MAIADHQKLSIDQSGDNSDYKAGFHRQVLSLITFAYDMLKATDHDYTNTDEPAITGEIVRFARRYIENQNSPEWAWPYAVHDDPPENDGKRKGKDRKRVDIIIERTQRGIHPRIRFEAKRLKKPGFTVGMYIGKKGLGEFISGNYAREGDTAGMLGYIQSDDCEYWAEQIPDALNKNKKEVCLIKGDQWQKSDFEKIDYCYKTLHDRPSINRELQVYHLLLNFVMPNSN